MKDTEKNRMARAGFTLVELVVVIVILGVLAGVAYPAYTGYIRKANDAKVQVELNEILLAAESACAEHGIDINGDTYQGETSTGPNGIMVSLNRYAVKMKSFSSLNSAYAKQNGTAGPGKISAGGTEVTNLQVQDSMIAYGDGQFDKIDFTDDQAYNNQGIAKINQKEFQTLSKDALKNTSYEGATWFAWSPLTGWYSSVDKPQEYTYTSECWITGEAASPAPAA